MLDVLYLRKNELNKLFRMTNKAISFALKNDGKFLIKTKLKTLDSMKNWMFRIPNPNNYQTLTIIERFNSGIHKFDCNM